MGGLHNTTYNVSGCILKVIAEEFWNEFKAVRPILKPSGLFLNGLGCKIHI